MKPVMHGLKAMFLLLAVATALRADDNGVNVSADNYGPVDFGTTVTFYSDAWASPGVLYGHYVYYRAPGGDWEILWSTYQDYIFTSTDHKEGSLELNQSGTWSFGGNASYTHVPDDNTTTPMDTGTFDIEVRAAPTPSVTSSLNVYVNQGQSVSYTLTGSNSPTTYSATGLPAGLSYNASTHVISGTLTASSNVNSTVSVSNAYGSDSRTLAWHVTAAAINPSASINLKVQQLGQSVVLTRYAAPNFGLAWTEGTIWRPDSSGYVLGTAGNGNQTYTPDGGTGTYSWQFRAIDVYGNYQDQWITFYVGKIDPFSILTSGGTAYDGTATNPVIAFGQSVTVSGTAYDPSGQMTSVTLTGDHGAGGSPTVYGSAPWTFSARSSYNFSATYQPSARGSGQHSMAAYGYYSGSPANWWGRGFNLVVNKATPTATFGNRSRAPSAGHYTVVSGDLDAAFVNPYSLAVAAPTGTVTYRFYGTTTAVTAGTQLAIGTNSIEAVYPGDGNYNTTTVVAVFTVTGPTVPDNFHATTTGSTFVALAWSASTVPSPATISGYDVYRDGVKLNASLITGTSYTDSTAYPGTAYVYTIKAVDSASNPSPASTLNLSSAAPLEMFTPGA